MGDWEGKWEPFASENFILAVLHFELMARCVYVEGGGGLRMGLRKGQDKL